MRRCVLIGNEIESIRSILPADPDTSFHDMIAVALYDDDGNVLAASAYYHIGKGVAGAIVGIPPSFLRKARPEHLRMLLLDEGKGKFSVVVKVHPGHRGAEKALMRVGFKPIYEHTYILWSPGDLKPEALFTTRT